MKRNHTNALVGFVVGVAGGLIGLGGGELRLPYLVGVLGLTAHQAVPVNLAIGLFIIVAAVPARLLALPHLAVSPYLFEALLIGTGAVSAAYLGAGWLRRLSAGTLRRLILVLLVVLGVAMLIEAWIGFASDGLLPLAPAIRYPAALLFGFLIGAISSVLGVAGGEVIIPTLVFGYGVPIKAASSLSMVISLPTVTTGILRHARAKAYVDRQLFNELILPMGLASVAGAILGGLMIGFAPAGLVKIALGILLVWSAWKVFTNHGESRKSGFSQEPLPEFDRQA